MKSVQLVAGACVALLLLGCSSSPEGSPGPDSTDTSSAPEVDPETETSTTVETDAPAPPATESDPPDVDQGTAAFDRLIVDGDPGTNGIYDPSLAYEPGGEVGWLAYTSAAGEISGGHEILDTHIARSDDNGETWEFIQSVNVTFDGSVPTPDGAETPGKWHYEVPNLVHDPTDPGREWKLFAHRIYWTPEGRDPVFSWITMRTAASPDGVWSDEVSMFASGRLPPTPFDDQQVHLDDVHPDLADNLIYSEPGALVLDDVLYLSLTGLDADGANAIELLRSTDHGVSWEYVDTLVDRADATALGLGALDGSDLVAVGDRIYVFVTPIDSPDYPGWVNAGTLVLEATDITSAEIRRDGDDAPYVVLEIPPQDLDSGSHGAGQAAYDEHNTAGGVLVPQINLAEPPTISQVFNTGINLPGD